MLVSIGEAGPDSPAASFCTAAVLLGEPVRMITWGDPVVRGFEVRAAGERLEPDTLPDEWLDGAWLLHVPADSLLREPPGAAARKAVEVMRRRRAMVAIDLASATSPPGDGAKLAFELAKLRPEILVAREEDGRALGVPLEGLARLPVLLLGDRGCELFGRRVPAPPGAMANVAAFTAALCSAYLDGAMPVEAAGRAMVFAAARTAGA